MIDARVVRDFFEGKISVRALADASEHAYTQTSSDVRRLNWKDLNSDFVVSVDHIVKLCDAVIEGALPSERLVGLAFGMIGDDHFLWDTDTPEGDRIGDTLYDWSAPEINYPLNPSTIAKFRHRLLTGEDTFTRSDFEAPSA